jgi:chaperonin GroEL
MFCNDILKNSQLDYGYDAKSEKYGNLYELGIIDPVKVTRTAVENAASVSSLLLTTECIITTVSENKMEEMMNQQQQYY